mmetsp:Transcript_17397/g.45207  ORF Transcript_17397/g.45207 Transcript_17397/m.45207 type:complete len:255 (-) Transcript_17397:7-771(-)
MRPQLQEGHVVVRGQRLHADVLLCEAVEAVGVVHGAVGIVLLLGEGALLVLVPVVRRAEPRVAGAFVALLAELPRQPVRVDLPAKVKHAVEGVPSRGGHVRRVGAHVLRRHHSRVEKRRAGESREQDAGIVVPKPVRHCGGLFQLGARAADSLGLVFRRPRHDEAAGVHAQQLSEVLVHEVHVVHDAHGGAAPDVGFASKGGRVVQADHRVVGVDDRTPVGPPAAVTVGTTSPRSMLSCFLIDDEPRGGMAGGT